LTPIRLAPFELLTKLYARLIASVNNLEINRGNLGQDIEPSPECAHFAAAAASGREYKAQASLRTPKTALGLRF